MKKEYVLMKDEKYKLIILLEKENFDYYTDVCIELIFDKKSIVLFKDNLLALKNIIDQYKENMDMLDDNLDENKLGILLNDYYRGFYENEFQNSLILDEQKRWVGERYCCYVSSEYATWIYWYEGNIIMKVTPIFGRFEEKNYVQEYYKFTRKYNDVFRVNVSLQQLICAKKIIYELYDELF